jgi:hypothetical protein
MTLLVDIFRLAALVVLLTVCITGCGSTGGPYRALPASGPDAIQIVIFRPDTFFQGGIPYQVNINGRESAILRNGEFTVINAQPGAVIIEVQSANWLQTLFHNPSLNLNAMAKDRFFVRATPRRGNTVDLSVISETEATPELKMLRGSQ